MNDQPLRQEWKEREKESATWIESYEGNGVWRQITASVPDKDALGWTALVEEHNAALAATFNRGRLEGVFMSPNEDEVKLEQQLAAEREKQKQMVDLLLHLRNYIQDDEHYESNIRRIDAAKMKYVTLPMKELTAEREKRKLLLEALERSRKKVVSLALSDFKLQWLDEIDNALAKVKDGTP